MREDTAYNFLKHYGVKGMKWGVRKSEVTLSTTPGKKVRGSGGYDLEAHDDAKKAATYKQKAKKSTTDALSNKELQDLVLRMNLEQQYKRLSESDMSYGEKFVRQMFVGAEKQQSKTAEDLGKVGAQKLSEYLMKRTTGG